MGFWGVSTVYKVFGVAFFCVYGILGDYCVDKIFWVAVSGCFVVEVVFWVLSWGFGCVSTVSKVFGVGFFCVYMVLWLCLVALWLKGCSGWFLLWYSGWL